MNENEEEHFFRKIYANFNLNFRYFKADFIEKALNHFQSRFEVNETVKDNQTLKDEIQQLTSDISALKDDISSMKIQAARNQETIQDLFAKIIEIRTENSKLETWSNSIIALQSEIEAIKQTHSTEIQYKSSEIKTWSDSVTEIQTRLQSIDEILKSFSNDLNPVKQTLNDHNIKINNQSNDFKGINDTISAINAEIQKINDLSTKSNSLISNIF